MSAAITLAGNGERLESLTESERHDYFNLPYLLASAQRELVARADPA